MTQAIAQEPSGWVVEAEQRSPVPTLAVILGIAFGAVGALLITIGAIGLPAASAVVSRLQSVTPAEQAGLDALLAVAPFLVGFGVVHVIAGLSLMTGQAWGRPMAGTLSVVTAGLAAATIVVIANKVGFFADTNSQTVLSSAATGVGILSLVALLYVVAAIAVVTVRPSR